MSVILVEGFDMYNGTGTNTGLQAMWLPITGSSGSGSMTTGRFGGQALRVNGGSTTSQWSARRNITSGSSAAAGFAFRASSLAAARHFFWMGDSAYQIGLRLNTNGSIDAGRYSAINGITVLGTSAAGVITVNTWAYIEVETTINASTGVLNVYVNGTNVISLSGVNTSNSGTAVSWVQMGFYDGGSTSGLTWDFDDLYVVDVATRLGERRVETLYPNGDTATKNFTPDTGTANYSRVNESQVDGDTSYVQSSTVGARDLYTIGSLSSTPTAIDAVNVVSFAEKTDATTRTLYNSVQSAGTDSDGSAFSLAASYGRFDRLLMTDPNGGGAWTASRVNGLQIGPKVAA